MRRSIKGFQEGAVKRTRVASVASVTALTAATVATLGVTGHASTVDQYPSKLDCGDAYSAASCTEVADAQSVFGHYVGHDEPSALFYSSTPGAGNDNLYQLVLPTDPPTLPKQNGAGGTFNFQLHPAFWFGMAMCDDQSAPNPGGSTIAGSPQPNIPCRADSDSNIYNSPTLTNSHYIGRHPGTAFMEMQFYPPGWAPWPAGNSCAATQWCAALNIDSLSENMNTGAVLNPTCQSITGVEYVNFAFITTDGTSQAPANPVNSTLATFTPDPSKDLFMNSGDKLRVDMFDTSSGFKVVIDDVTTGQSGSMTAGIANKFGEVQFAPSGSSCTNIPTNFHPAYSTSSPNTRVPWAAHSYNAAFSDEIGHFEYCNGVSSRGICHRSGVNDSAGLDSDDVGCFSPSQSTLIKIGGCLGTDSDFDGVPYGTTWPGTLTDSTQDAALHPGPVLFTSPLTGVAGSESTKLQQVAFEADLPRIEFATNPPCQRHISNPADPSPGTGCVDPPVGVSFYPFYTTSIAASTCWWNLGGAYIPGTHYFNRATNSQTAYGPLSTLFYAQWATAGTTQGPTFRYNDFNSGALANTC